jgi:hypothetical protein
MLSLFFFGLGIYYLGSIAYLRFYSPLSKCPGPFWASISRTWIIWQVIRGDLEKTQRILHEKHGEFTFKNVPAQTDCEIR